MFLKNTMAMLFTIVFFYTGSCYAGFDYDTGNLKEDCHQAIMFDDDHNAHVNLLNIGQCLGFIEGFVDTHVYYAKMLSGNSGEYKEVEKHFLFCLDSGVTRIDIARLIVKYLDDNPEKLHYSASSTLMGILAKKFPCKN